MSAWVGRRGQTVLRAGTWSLVSKGLAAGAYLLSIPLAYTSLEPTEFGIWATLVSIVAFSTFLDFGIGNGCMNLMASAHGRGDEREVASIFRLGSRILGAIALALFGVFCAISAAQVVFGGALGGMAPETMASISTAVAAAVFSAPLSLGLRARLATARGDSAFKWQAAGHVGVLAALGLAVAWDAGILGFTCAAVLPPVLASACNALSVALEPSFRHPLALDKAQRRELTRVIAGEGFLFFVLQGSAALTFSADLLLISSMVGPGEAGHYAVSQRIFSIVPMGLALLWAPLWPVYRASLASGDRPWVARTLKRSLSIALAAAAIMCPILVVFHDGLLSIFAPGHPGAPLLLLVGFAVWTVMEAAGTAVATFLNSASVLRFQVASASLVALVSVGLKLWVLERDHVSWVPWATSMTYLVFFAIPLALSWRRIWHAAMRRSY